MLYILVLLREEVRGRSEGINPITFRAKQIPMTSVIILEPEHPAASPDTARISSVLEKLRTAGYAISRLSAASAENPVVSRILAQKGNAALPITLVNNFPMITGRYPSNDELKQILAVPDGIIEPKHCGCCCIEGCGCE